MNSPNTKYFLSRKQATACLFHGHFVVIIFLAIFLLPSINYAASPSEEQKIKTAIIYKVPKFVKWPNRGFNEKNSHFNICVLGTDAFSGALNALTGRKIFNTPIKINNIKTRDLNTQFCQVLFISSTQSKNLPTILARLENAPILTISDIYRFATHGGMIEIYKHGKRLAFRINNKAARKANLELAAPLLDMATVVEK